MHETALLKEFAEDEVRVVVRPTWVYSTLLDESTHPDLLKDAGERQRVLETLRTDVLGTVLAPDLVDEEIAQLWAGDVPLFTARPGRDHLWGAAERPLAGRADLSGIARVAARLAALDAVDRQDQEWIVRAAMATASRAPAHRPVGDRRTRTAERAPEPERLLSAARSVGDRLVSLAYREGPRSNWIGLELLDDRYWRIGPMPADLAGGYTGPALFLAQLAALTGAGHYAEVARTALAPVPGLLDALRARPADLGAVGSGAFSGLGGIAYALAETARLLDDPETGSWASAAQRLAGAAALSEREYGVGAGVAGGLVALLAAHRAGGGDEAQETWRDARACADRLTAVDPTAGGRGFTTGAAGLGWALLRFAEAEASAGPGGAAAEGSERYRLAGLSALRAAVGGEPAGGRGPGATGEPLRTTGPRTRPGPRPGAGARRHRPRGAGRAGRPGGPVPRRLVPQDRRRAGPGQARRRRQPLPRRGRTVRTPGPHRGPGGTPALDPPGRSPSRLRRGDRCPQRRSGRGPASRPADRAGGDRARTPPGRVPGARALPAPPSDVRLGDGPASPTAAVRALPHGAPRPSTARPHDPTHRTTGTTAQLSTASTPAHTKDGP
ncbi:hypothetical protein GCM10020254_17900 [Streptomyces goshikiensis]